MSMPYLQPAVVPYVEAHRLTNPNRNPVYFKVGSRDLILFYTDDDTYGLGFNSWNGFAVQECYQNDEYSLIYQLEQKIQQGEYLDDDPIAVEWLRYMADELRIENVL